ncbi:hypothetical protein ABT279_49245, partial [Amycolatopsis sp. NPDC000673]|uniref:hypothetical protein n=1 Tax=Amycolatopsis sp. NPDC000673 TaxID=3154267 RepID=UPI00332FD151
MREAVAKFAQRVAALAAVEGDPGQAAVLKSAAERYVAVGATGPDVDLGGELLFRRWVQGRLPAGGADERVVQALALLGHRPLTPEERERAVVTIMNVDADGNQTETQLEDKDQQMLDHVLDHGTATRRDIASAVLGETDTAAINKTRSVLDNRLDNDYHLVEKTQDGKKPVIYTARVPPPGGVVWRDVSPAGVLPKVRAHLEAHPGRGHTLTEMADAFKVYRRDSVRKALEKLVETGVASRRVEDGTVQYWLVPEELRPEAEKAKKAKKGDVRREVVEFLEAEENLGKFFTIAEIGRHTEFDETSVRSVTQRVSEVEEGEPKTIASGQKAKTFGIKTAGHARLKPGAGGKRRLEGVEGGAKRARGGVAGVGRVVSGLMDPAAAVSEGRARVLAELAGDFAVAVASGGTAAGLQVRGYFGPEMKSSDGRAYEASVTAALLGGVRERLAGMGEDVVSGVLADVMARLDMEPVAVRAGDARAGTFVAWAGGAEPPVLTRPVGAPVPVRLEDLLGGLVNPADISVVALHSGEGQYAVGFPAPGPLDERSVLEEALE